MIIKAHNNLYNMDGWKNCITEDGYLEVKFFSTYEIDGEVEYFKHLIELIDDDYYSGLLYENERFDHKDQRCIKRIAEDKAYAIVLEEIRKGTEFIDLDVILDQEKLCKEATEQYLKEFE